MNKDPAFLFYFRDFLVSTELMAVEDVGYYIRILCHMADKGRLTLEHMQSICKAYGTAHPLHSKFKQDDHGLYFNTRLEEEVAKRGRYTQSRRENAKHMHKHMPKHMVGHMGNANDNANEDAHTTIIKQGIHEVFAFFCFTLNKKILLSKERAAIIEARLKEGRTLGDLKMAITNFSKDDWSDRHKFCDIVYVLGVRNKVDNLDKWLTGPQNHKPVPLDHPKDCPDCWGAGLEYPPGGQPIPCRRKY